MPIRCNENLPTTQATAKLITTNPDVGPESLSVGAITVLDNAGTYTAGTYYWNPQIIRLA